LTSVTPPGKEPLTVNAGVPVELLLMYTPEEIVACNADEPFHPAAVAREARFAFVLFVEMVNENIGDVKRFP
jgi:hypothetical protein